MVYVISKTGKPLMPTENHAKVRKMLRDGRAKCVKRTPFTIQLQYDSEENTQPITLGVDAGSRYVGLSATTEKKEVFAAETEIRSDISKNLSDRRERKHTRRCRKLRYRKPRYNNKKSNKPKGWLPPSTKEKIDSHIRLISIIASFIPVSRIIIEVASFDIRKIKDPTVRGADYQEGEQLGFWNVREYVFHRDNHICQCCKGRTGDPILNVHHIETRRTGGNAPNNLITLCETCHKGYHKGTIQLPATIKRGESFKDAAVLGTMRWACYNKLKELYPDVRCTFGYKTKNTRINAGLAKSHISDARCISGYPLAIPSSETFKLKKIRRHNRQIHKMTISKGGLRKRNQATYTVKGFRLFDKVLLNGMEGFIYGRRSSGYFDIRTIDGDRIHAGIFYKKLKLLEKPRGFIIERRHA